MEKFIIEGRGKLDLCLLTQNEGEHFSRTPTMIYVDWAFRVYRFGCRAERERGRGRQRGRKNGESHVTSLGLPSTGCLLLLLLWHGFIHPNHRCCYSHSFSIGMEDK